QAALIARGIQAERLTVATYGASQPIASAQGETGRAKNRRVELVILERVAAAPSAPARPRTRPEPPRLAAASAAASTRTRAAPARRGGAVRYGLSEPVSIRRGAAAMVSILNQRVPGRDVFLFRPDGNAPGSDRHPFRAVRLVNRSGYTLEPGPIAIFA